MFTWIYLSSSQAAVMKELLGNQPQKWNMFLGRPE